jgi:23S rRNA pseudouridine2457 synthase
MQKRYYLIYKPYGVLSQFTREHPSHQVLGDLHDFPSDVYPVGRLDKDSEGLLILTNDKKLNHQLLNPSFRHQRTYWVQVEGQPTAAAIKQLEEGVDIRIDKKNYHTLPAEAKVMPPPPLPEREPPIRYRKNVPDSWISLSLTEGKNRQVRRMCAQVGFPVLRLVRASIEGVRLGKMSIGEVRPIAAEQIYSLLKIK